MSGLSAYLQIFLRDSISTYEELETLLHLRRNSDRAWSTLEVARALGASDESIAAALDGLSTVEGLLQLSSEKGEARYQYLAKSKLLRQVVDELNVAYTEQRLTVVQIMSANSLDRMRSAAMRRLADAFSIQRPKK